MEEKTAGTALSPELEAEAFRRVWERVRPQGDGPVVPAARPEQAARGEAEGGTEHAPGARPEPEDDGAREVLRLPAASQPQHDIPCLGTRSRAYLHLLEEMLERARQGEQMVRRLSRRTGGGIGRSLAAMAEAFGREERRLGAAYFLISGERPPASRTRPAPLPPLPQALRELFALEQRWSAAYDRAALDTLDPCLRELYQELSEESRKRSGEIRRLVEQL